MDLKLIGKRIKEIRTRRNIPQTMLAAKAEISEPYLSNIECGKKKASIEVLIRIANALDTTVDCLLSGIQLKDGGHYENDVAELMKGCTQYEKRVILEMAAALKKSLKENHSIIEDEIITAIQSEW